MSKKPPKAKPVPVGELIAARIVEEQAWAWERRIVDALPWPAIRALALRPRDAGGIGQNVSVGALRNMVAAHRAAQGEMNGSREERIERRQLEYDAIALAARAALVSAANRTIDGVPYPTIDEKAAKLLLDARAAESKMHGDDAALRIEADVTTHDAVTDELNAMLVRLGEPEVKAEA